MIATNTSMERSTTSSTYVEVSKRDLVYLPRLHSLLLYDIPIPQDSY